MHAGRERERVAGTARSRGAPAHDLRATRDHANDRVVVALADRRGRAAGRRRRRVARRVQRFGVVDRDRLVRQVAGRHHERATATACHQQVVERRVRQHDAELGEAGGDRRGQRRGRRRRPRSSRGSRFGEPCGLAGARNRSSTAPAPAASLALPRPAGRPFPTPNAGSVKSTIGRLVRSGARPRRRSRRTEPRRLPGRAT